MKTSLILVAFLCFACMPADKKALERTNKNVADIAQHDIEQDKLNRALAIKVFGDMPQLPAALKAFEENGKNNLKNAVDETNKNVGIINADKFKEGGFIEKTIDVVSDVAGATPWGSIITTALTILGGFLGKGTIDGIRSRRKEKIKKEVLKRQDPKDSKKFDDLVAAVEKEVKEGKIKV